MQPTTYQRERGSHQFLVRGLAALAAAAAVAAYAPQRSPLGRPWPPPVQAVDPASPPLGPEDALRTFYMPPGYQLELVAGEPLVQDPVAIDFDPGGRLWVVEMPGFMPDIEATGEHAPIGRVVVLEDRDGDGRMDRRTIFADGLVLARAVKVLDRGVLVGEPPNAWLMRDIDGDLRADTKELVTDRYGRREVDPQNNANGFYWALDNRMHMSGQSDIQLRLGRDGFEVRGTLRRGQWGVTQDDAGRIYRNTNESALHVDLVPTPYFARNPNLVRTRGSYDRLAEANPELNTVWPVRPTPGTNRMYQTGVGRPDGTLARFTSVCSPLVYRGHRLPDELYGNVFVAEPAGNLVSRLVLDDDGTGLRARKGYERGEFLASTDERFRPVFLSNAPDGTLYIVDMYRGIIEHRISITEYLRDQIASRRLETPIGFGRIYRVVHETTARDGSAALADASPEALVAALAHRSGWWRDTAQRLLVERQAGEVAPQLGRLASEGADWRTRLHALWTLDGLERVQPEIVLRALQDPSRDVRAAAIRVAERWMDRPTHPVTRGVLALLDDRDWAVRHQLAASLGALSPEAGNAPLVALLARHGGDPVTVDAALSGLRGREVAILDLLSRRDAGAPRDAALTMLAATIFRGGQDAAAQRVLRIIADDSRAAAVRDALLRGAEVAVLGAAPPGTPASLRPPAAGPAGPCPTCPGGRAGPGGAYAFPRPPGWPTGAGDAARRPALRLNQEPAALVALASGRGERAKRAARVLERTGWPGKPGAGEPVPPLGPEDRKRFAAGSEVYRNLCQACHQPDGRGQDRLAPTLIDSPLALADPGVPVRVLLHGKEGSFGLMPPVGATLSDDQIANVLTYIRREWGHGGTPVSPSEVEDVRRQTAARTRPWTDAELSTLP